MSSARQVLRVRINANARREKRSSGRRFETKQETQTAQERPQAHPTWVKHHKRRNTLVLLAAGLIVLSLVGVLVLSSSSSAQVGQLAPDFTAEAINNTSFHLFGYRGTPVLMEFMRTTCPHCVNEAPTLASLWQTRGNKVVFVSITTMPSEDTTSVLMGFSQMYHMPWIWVQDLSGLTNNYSVSGTPTIFLLDKNSVIRYRWTGETSLQTLDAGIQSVL